MVIPLLAMPYGIVLLELRLCAEYRAIISCRPTCTCTMSRQTLPHCNSLMSTYVHVYYVTSNTVSLQFFDVDLRARVQCHAKHCLISIIYCRPTCTCTMLRQTLPHCNHLIYTHVHVYNVMSNTASLPSFHVDLRARVQCHVKLCLIAIISCRPTCTYTMPRQTLPHWQHRVGSAIAEIAEKHRFNRDT